MRAGGTATSSADAVDLLRDEVKRRIKEGIPIHQGELMSLVDMRPGPAWGNLFTALRDLMRTADEIHLRKPKTGADIAYEVASPREALKSGLRKRSASRRWLRRAEDTLAIAVAQGDEETSRQARRASEHAQNAAALAKAAESFAERLRRPVIRKKDGSGGATGAPPAVAGEK